MIWFWLAAVLIALSLGVAGLTCLIMYFEMGADAEPGELRRLSGGRPGRWLLRCLATGTASQAVSLLLYPAFLVAPLWLPRPGRPNERPIERPDAPAVLFVHGIFHTASAWVFFSRRFARLGLPRCHVWSYRSFAQGFDDVVAKLDRRVRRVLEAEPGRPLALVGHSMGGLAIRGWLSRADAGTRARVAAVVTLGAPHQGSRLAGLGATRMARSLAFRGELVRSIEAAEVPPPCPCLSLRTPVDNMVVPPEGARILAHEGARGWTEEDTAPVSHIWLLYHGPAMDRAARFILDASASHARPDAAASHAKQDASAS